MLKKLSRQSSVRRFALWILVILTAVTIITFQQVRELQSPLKMGTWFTRYPLNTTYQIYDLGVADINNDNWFDVFTANHNARQSLLVNNASGKFTDQLLDFGFSQYAEFPGLEASLSEPLIQSPGLYIYWKQAELVIRAHNLSNNVLKGEINLIYLSDKVKTDSGILQTQGRFQALLSKNKERDRISFSATENGQLNIFSHYNKYIIIDSLFKLDEDLPLDQIYIGTERIHPNSHEFEISIGKDRHGLSWADYNGDQQLDVFIVRGGRMGTMEQNSPVDRDEFLIQDNLTFHDRTVDSGLLKNACPARQVAPVDFDKNGQLDLYVVCGRGKPPRQKFPNQLYQQKDGRFIEVAAEKGLDIPEKGSFTWLDADIDGDMDLLWIGASQEFWLYDNQVDRFEPQFIGSSQGGVKQLTFSDYDADGDFDVFAASSHKSTLLNNENGTFEIVDPQSIGLPLKSHAANWVDYDNDGLMDLHVLPNGLYRQNPDHQFEPTHLLEVNSYSLRNHDKFFSTWFDANNDGSRDLLVAIEDQPYAWMPSKVKSLWEQLFPPDGIFRLSKWDLILYPSIGAKNHWLQIQLIGLEGNRQAIGAQVEVETADGTQLAQVGQAEGSLFSQGHYRLYFGLGQYQSADSVRIFWPDGTLQEIKNVKGDQILSIDRIAQISSQDRDQP